MKLSRMFATWAVFTFMAPFLVIGWIAGAIWKALDAGFWHAGQWVDQANDYADSWHHEVKDP